MAWVLFLKAVTDVGSQEVALAEGVLQVGEVVGQGVAVGGGERGVAAGEGLAVVQDGPVGGGAGRSTQGAVGVVDAGDEDSEVQVQVRFVAGHDAAKAGFVGGDLAVEDGVAGEFGEPPLGLGASRAGQCRTVLAGGHAGEELASGEGFFGLDLVADPEPLVPNGGVGYWNGPNPSAIADP
ncbi:hypothetical protein OG432_00215 [Streptomyces sp. NBC_00442]|uniref:hypothetical protein n=1 Tax=Streptomyces sp. NBC_00442 TaxID=2903651 RepID=UPI002E1D7D82